jgi:hypothetical protein
MDDKGLLRRSDSRYAFSKNVGRQHHAQSGRLPPIVRCSVLVVLAFERWAFDTLQILVVTMRP